MAFDVVLPNNQNNDSKLVVVLTFRPHNFTNYIMLIIDDITFAQSYGVGICWNEY